MVILMNAKQRGCSFSHTSAQICLKQRPDWTFSHRNSRSFLPHKKHRSSCFIPDFFPPYKDQEASLRSSKKSESFNKPFGTARQKPVGGGGGGGGHHENSEISGFFGRTIPNAILPFSCSPHHDSLRSS